MAQEEHVAATLEPSAAESPSPSKRRNRKKGRRGSEGDEQEASAAVSPIASTDVATANLVSLPLPVATSSSISFDVFATTSESVEQAMGHLALTKEKEKEDGLLKLPMEKEDGLPKLPIKKEDGLLKLPIHPSSGRVPLTPPSTPEPFMMHSPEKDQAQVAPIAMESHVLPAVEEAAVEQEREQVHVAEVESVEDVEQHKVETSMEEVQEVAIATAEMPMELIEPAGNAVEEQETFVLSSTLADMTLTNDGAMPSDEPVATVKWPEAEEEVVSVPSQLHVELPPVTDDHEDVLSSLMSNVELKSITAESIEYTAPSVEPTAIEDVPTETLVAIELAPVEIPVTIDLASETPNATEEAPTQSPLAEEAVPAQQKEALPESSQLPRRNKRKGDSPEQKPHTTPTAISRPFVKAHQVKTVPPSRSSENAGQSKLVAPKDTSDSQVQSRPAKRKGGASDDKAPIPTAPKEIRPKRLVARSSTGSTLNKTKGAADAKPKPEVASRPVQDAKKESMKNPTASSIARATAAEARKALLKSATTKNAPVRKPLRTRPAAKAAVPIANLATEQVSAPPPAPVAIDNGDDGQRHVKRRLNATDAEAASKRLFEDAKGAKLRKDARRAELEENYTFAPKVNNSKRRTPPGEAEGPSQDRFSRLHAQAKEMLEKKRELQQQHERDGCTFAPTISARAKRLSEKSSGPRYENLYKHAQQLKQKREEKLMERAKTTEEECPFKPRITASASKSSVKAKPLYDSEREKQKRLAREQKKIEAEMSECTFKPKVTAKRLKSKTEEPSDVPANSAAGANPFNRLYQASIDRTDRLQKLRQDRDEEEKAQAPFQPKITARSRVAKGKAKSKQPFHERLYNKDYMKKLDAEREQRRLEGEQQFTFKPEINELPEEIKAKVNERASPHKSIFERLYDEKDKMKEKIEMSEELRLQKEMVECTFRPQIEADAVQSNGEPVPPVWERLLSYDKAQVIEEREKLREQLEMQECTFKPEVKSPDPSLMQKSPSFNVFDRLTGNGSNSPLDPTRPSFITTRRPSSSPGRQSPDAKGISIGRIVKSKKLLPAERKPPSRTYSTSQPSSVTKEAMKRSTSFSGPKSASASPTVSMGDVIFRLHAMAPTLVADGDSVQLD